jgi:hypothetical protein
MSNSTVRGITVATRCATIADFIERYADRADEDSIFVGTALDDSLRAIHTECAFAFLLDNKKPVLAGTCVVRDLHADASNPFRRQGLRVRIVRLGPSSSSVFAAMRRVRTRRAREFIDAQSSDVFLDEAATQPLTIPVQTASFDISVPSPRRSNVLVVAALAVAALAMIFQSRPVNASAHASAPTWLGMPVFKGAITKPVESTAPRHE